MLSILRVHNEYRYHGGEEAVSASEVDLLRIHGQEVETLRVSNNELGNVESLGTKLRLAASTVWSAEGRGLIADAAKKYRPDIVHFDNTLPRISPAAYSIARDAGAAVVQTLHNFRLVCPNGLFFRDGHVCEDCLGKTPPYPGVVHGCYRKSKAQTAAVAAMLTSHRARRTWTRDVDRYIALNEFSRGKFIEGGLPSDRIVVKPNFVELPEATTPVDDRRPFFYVGRLSVEKGISTVLEAWTAQDDLPVIDVVGDGPFLQDALAAAEQNSALLVLGRRPREEVLERMRSAFALVFPSGCYENFPVSIAEAYACGVPVIASNHGAMAELVHEGETGIFFEPGNADDLAEKVRWAAEHPDEMRRMGENARREYLLKYTPERNYEMLMDIYEQAIEHRRADA